ncbi:unnamed protein product [Dibothriocephalus latus]|uniref:Uncharacterized protein n=1 Tax=Dibothriocephalus latus TaxID=60516 RepID=A0A3P7MBJ9_DIBLA|nr:unnamed protein product [Dibothriocephalus latus]
MQAVFKESPSTIPTICIENSSCNEPSARNSPICDVNSPFLIASNEDFLGKSLSFNVQVSQFLCWFSELTEPRKLLFTALVVKNTSPDFLQIAHTLLEHRLLSFQSPELVQKANSLDHVKSLFSISNPSELTQTLLHLLSHLSTEPSTILSGSVNKDDKTSDHPISGSQGAEYNETIRRYYLDLIDKVFENLSTLRTHKCPTFTSRAELATQQPSSLDDPVDTNEGQILLLAISHPVFDSKDKQWLLSRLLRYRDLSKHDTDEELGGGDILNSLTTLAADLLDILVESSDPDSPVSAVQLIVELIWVYIGQQSASPYASHCAESQLKEGDEESVFLEPHSSSPPRPLAEPANTDGSESSDASPNIPCLVAVQLPRENEVSRPCAV